MSDWTTARVVRDCESWLWARVGHRMWMQMDGDMRIGTQGLAKFGPLVPVLDADGLPVVRTVGDQLAERNGAELLAKQSQSAARDDAARIAHHEAEVRAYIAANRGGLAVYWLAHEAKRQGHKTLRVADILAAMESAKGADS